MTSTLLFKNNAATTLSSATITDSVTTFNVTSSANFPAVTTASGDYFYATMYELSGAVEVNIEIVKVTDITGVAWTVTRAQEGTIGVARVIGTAAVYIENRMTAAAATLMLQSSRNLADIGAAATARTNLGLGSVENTALSTWVGTANITTLGTIATGTWNATAIADSKIASALTGKTYNGLTLTALATGFTVAGGTSSKTLTLSNTLTFAGTDGSTLNVGTGGTLGTAAFTATTAYAPAAGSSSIVTVGTIGSGTWQGTDVGVEYGGTGVSTLTGLVKGNGTSAFSAATVRTDYAEPTTALATGILKNTTTTGAHTIATAGTDYLAPPAGTAMLKGNSGGALADATAGTDYSAGTSALATGIVKNTTTTGALSIASAGTDYMAPASTINVGTTNFTLNRASASQNLTGVNIDGSAGSATTATTATKSNNLTGGNPTTLLGSLPYQSNTDTTSLLPPNTTATKNFLSQTGTGTDGAAPAWEPIDPADVTGTALVAAAIGTTVQAYDADLTTWAAVTPGTGVATALAVNIGSAGAPVLFNGAGGTPSSLTGTNITGTAAGLTAGNVTTNANLTGHITSTGNAAVLGSFTKAQLDTAVSDADLAILGANTFTGAQILSDQQVSRAMLIDFGHTVVDKGNISAATVTFDYTGGSIQTYTATGSTVTWGTSNWPPTGNLGELLIIGTNMGAFTHSISGITWIKPDGTTTTSLATYLAANTGRTAFQTSGVDQILLWSRDAGTTIYGKLV